MLILYSIWLLAMVDNHGMSMCYVLVRSRSPTLIRPSQLLSVIAPTGFGQVTLQGQRQLVLAGYVQCLSSIASIKLDEYYCNKQTSRGSNARKLPGWIYPLLSILRSFS